jgi:hypothetical protein
MKYQIYKPNSKNTGCAMNFSIGVAKDGAPTLYISSILQSGWNEKTKTGSFSGNAKNPSKSGNFKMNANEAGEIISSFNTRIPSVFFHKFNEDTTIIKFTPWDKEKKIKTQNGEETYKSPAFGISISKNSSSNFKLALEAGETEVLSILLKEFISRDLLFQAEKQKEYQSDRPVYKEKESVAKQEEIEDEEDVPF